MNRGLLPLPGVASPRFLRLCVSLTLLSRGWLTWKWDSPLRALFWNEDWLAGPLENLFGVPWSDFATRSDPFLSRSFDGVGIFLILSAILLWILPRRAGNVLLWTSTGILVLDSLGRWLAADFQFGMAIEHALQIVAPVALILAEKRETPSPRWLPPILIASALTFAGHGFYAAGIHPVPLDYQTMTMKLLGLEQKAALLLLLTVGWLDIIAAAALALPRFRIPALLYMVAWGGLTALARIASHIGLHQPRFGLDPWIAETLVRTSHWALPLLALLYLRKAPAVGESPDPRSS